MTPTKTQLLGHRYIILMKLDPNKTYIIERSPWTDYHCFCKLCYERGDISEMEMTIYKTWFNTLIKEITDKFDLPIEILYNVNIGFF